jgi:ribosomal protein S18 acetylase RimI-like enzyme
VFCVKEKSIFRKGLYNENDEVILNIREFRLTDQTIVKQLILDGLKEHFGRIDPTLNPDLNDIYKSYVQAGHYFVVGEIGGEIVGTAALVQESTSTGRIVRVTVSPQQRRSGIGRQLVHHLLKKAKTRAFKQVLVETNNDWFDAIRLYKGCGFEEFDRDDESVHFSLTL